jgi:hypothetical protein
VHDALGNPLVIEVRDFLAEDEILEQRRPTQAGFQRALIVADRHTLVGGESLTRGVDPHAVERPDGLVMADRGSAAAHLLGTVHFRHGAGTDDRIMRHDDLPGLGSRRGVPVVLEWLVAIERHARRECLGPCQFRVEIVQRRRRRRRL